MTQRHVKRKAKPDKGPATAIPHRFAHGQPALRGILTMRHMLKCKAVTQVFMKLLH